MQKSGTWERSSEVQTPAMGQQLSAKPQGLPRGGGGVGTWNWQMHNKCIHIHVTSTKT